MPLDPIDAYVPIGCKARHIVGAPADSADLCGSIALVICTGIPFNFVSLQPTVWLASRWLPFVPSPSAAAALGVSVALCATDGNQNNWEGRAPSTVFS